MRLMLFRCDNCRKEASNLGLMPGWLEVRFFNPRANREFFYHFCGYSCLVQWAEQRESYYGNVLASRNKEIDGKITEEL